VVFAYAVQFSLQAVVEVLLNHQADVNARDKNWQTPLHVAAANNAISCAELLLPLVASINTSDRGGRTSVHHAAYNGHFEVTGLSDTSVCVCVCVRARACVNKPSFCESGPGMCV